MTILAISSQVVAGHVGNSAAQFVLQTLGHTVWAIPTVLLSHHPGHGTPGGRSTPPEELARLLDSLWDGGWMDQVTAVMTGYFTSPDQVTVAARSIDRLKQMAPGMPVLVDPIMGDDGTIYVAQDVPSAIRDVLLPLATITTPNLFELSVLTKTSWPMSGEADVASMAKSLGSPETLVTSAPGASSATITTRLISPGTSKDFDTPRVTSPPNGIGDVTAAAYLGLRLSGATCTAAASKASWIVKEMIDRANADGLKELPLITCRKIIAATSDGT